MLTRVLPWLYLGGKSEARDITALRVANVRLIVNCTPPRTEDPVAGVPNFFEGGAAGGGERIKYVRFSMYDNAGQRLASVLDDALAILERGQHHGSILVHCAQGISRSVAIVAAFLIKQHGLSLDGAISHIHAMGRPQAKPNDSFMRQLRAFESTVAAQRASGALGPPTTLPIPPDDDVKVSLPAAESRKRTRDDAHPKTSTDTMQGPASGPAVRPTPLFRAARVDTLSDEVPCQSSVAAVVTSETERAKSREAVANSSTREFSAERSILCDECEASLATVQCSACNVYYCSACDVTTHAVPAVGTHEHARRVLASTSGEGV